MTERTMVDSKSEVLREGVRLVQEREIAVVPERAVGRGDLHSAPLERRDRRLAGAREPEDEHLLRQSAQRNPVK